MPVTANTSSPRGMRVLLGVSVMAKKKSKGVDKIAVKMPRKPGQVSGVGTPGTTTYTGKPGVSGRKKKV